MSFTESDIRWTDTTYNPVHGCSKTSEGCRHCYAERVSRRFGHTDHDWTIQNVDENITLKPQYLEKRLPEPRWCFVNSMSDLYHPQVPDEFIYDVYDALRDMHESAFQVLTKHGADHDRDIPHPPDNVMLGVSVESPRRRTRIDWLRNQPANVRFVSFEPLVEYIPTVDLTGIDWAIIGGESHPNADERRDMDPAWARNLVLACRRQNVAVFFKQHSGPRPERDVELDMHDGQGPRKFEEFPYLPAGIVDAPQEFLEEAGGQQTLATDGGTQSPGVDNGPRVHHDSETCPECQLLDAGHSYDAPARPTGGDES